MSKLQVALGQAVNAGLKEYHYHSYDAYKLLYFKNSFYGIPSYLHLLIAAKVLVNTNDSADWVLSSTEVKVTDGHWYLIVQ